MHAFPGDERTFTAEALGFDNYMVDESYLDVDRRDADLAGSLSHLAMHVGHLVFAVGRTLVSPCRFTGPSTGTH